MILSLILINLLFDLLVEHRNLLGCSVESINFQAIVDRTILDLHVQQPAENNRQQYSQDTEVQI